METRLLNWILTALHLQCITLEAVFLGIRLNRNGHIILTLQRTCFDRHSLFPPIFCRRSSGARCGGGVTTRHPPVQYYS
jgi:hypothetical protein